MRQVLIYAGEDGYWVAECPSLPGCISQGKDSAEALENIRAAIHGSAARQPARFARKDAIIEKESRQSRRCC